MLLVANKYTDGIISVSGVWKEDSTGSFVKLSDTPHSTVGDNPVDFPFWDTGATLISDYETYNILRLNRGWKVVEKH